jgi:DNA-binding LacI/PurR family transcriptional regulator
MQPPRRITVRDIAEACGVHYTTVARSLKNDPRISAATREKVTAVAKRLGYMADPMMAAFSAYRQKNRIASFHGTLAWVTNFSGRTDWKNPATELYFQGARERAQELGYKLEEFWLRESGMSPRRASNILISRGVRGLLLCPQPGAHTRLDIQWESFSAVTLGYSMSRPNLHRVTTAHFHSVGQLFAKLRRLGHKRIGLVCWKHANERNDRLWSAGYLDQTDSHAPEKALPVCSCRKNGHNKKAFFKWYERHKPDAIITNNYASGPLQWLQERGVSVPGETSVAMLSLQQRDTGLAGIDERPVLIGRAATDLIARMLSDGERGIPDVPIRMMIEGGWVNGWTVAKRS